MSNRSKLIKAEVNRVIEEKLTEYPEKIRGIVLEVISLSKSYSSTTVEKIMEGRLREISKGEMTSDS